MTSAQDDKTPIEYPTTLPSVIKRQTSARAPNIPRYTLTNIGFKNSKSEGIKATMNAQSKMSSESPGDTRMPATGSEPESSPKAEHSHADTGTGIKLGATSVADDEEDDWEEHENPHLPPLREYLKMTEERKNV
ncbi:uncharacterized protein DSM5745_00985 [Aspergillus mulundensis]|uniref:Uncharacterized protein n=1 Tax=Aspergillus mulundensis TaxID=1810919 RepID=A0A3D8T534_9EURO|nr:hypothetical protein DSM5745_00985 [Aspergillus mulundensis]RDW93663.1 hypothetical protein DSM5745_00985 [Aspergillus mulundensis]